jgi:hypothetical protein
MTFNEIKILFILCYDRVVIVYLIIVNGGGKRSVRWMLGEECVLNTMVLLALSVIAL